MSDSSWTALAAELVNHASDLLEEQLQQSLATPLADWALLQIEGPDCRKFLQGQLTCNLEELSAEQALAGAYCTPKGRMLANFLVIGDGTQRCWLRLPANLLETTQTALAKYAVFSKVKLTPLNYLGIGLAGPDAARAIANLLPGDPVRALHCRHNEDRFAIQLDDAGQRFELWLTEERATSVWEQLRQQINAASPAAWALLDIRAGLGQVCAATSEQYLPQMLNLDVLGALSFRKGCYTGQEVVARLHYRGKAKRRMYRLEGDGAAPAAGTSLQNGAGQNRAEVVNAVDLGNGRFEALAVLGDAGLDEALFCPGSETPVRLLPLPYAITINPAD